jgi:hypothetical protein
VKKKEGNTCESFKSYKTEMFKPATTRINESKDKGNAELQHKTYANPA